MLEHANYGSKVRLGLNIYVTFKGLQFDQSPFTYLHKLFDKCLWCHPLTGEEKMRMGNIKVEIRRELAAAATVDVTKPRAGFIPTGISR